MCRPAQINLVYNTTVLQVQKEAFFWHVDQKWYARRLSNFVNVWIWCSGTLPYFPHVCKGNVRHVTAGKVRGNPSVQLYGGSVLIALIGGTLLGVRATHNTETTFSTCPRDLSRCLNLSQYCA